MGTTAFHNAFFGRTLIWAVAGTILGFIIEPLCFWDAPPEGGGIRLPVIGPTLGAGICIAFALFLGGVRLQGVVKHTTISTVVGILAGVLIGASLFAAIMTSLDPHGGGVLHGKVFAAYQHGGIIFGIPIGAVCGMTAGIIYTVLHRKRHPPAT